VAIGLSYPLPSSELCPLSLCGLELRYRVYSHATSARSHGLELAVICWIWIVTW
jgi:hypothetical protein